jgi:hypothetical protein
MALSSIVLVQVFGVSWPKEAKVVFGDVSGLVVGYEMVDRVSVCIVAVDVDQDVDFFETVGSTVQVAVNDVAVGSVVSQTPVVAGRVVARFVSKPSAAVNNVVTDDAVVTGVVGNVVMNNGAVPWEVRGAGR